MPTVSVLRQCRLCGTLKSFLLPEGDYHRWQGGEYIQDVFPTMPVDDREFLISSTCPVCWDDMFSSEEYDD